MKNWLIEKLGGVSKKDHEEVIQAANSLKNMADDYSQRISDGLKEKAEMEEAGKEMSERISELIDKLNEERKVSNGLMAKMTAQTQKIEELQAEIEAKNAELARVKSEVISISKVKAGTALSAENQRLRAELELLKRNKFKRGKR
ncbi:Uncharacterised protein [Neisseria subflava]|uniref:Uncharacterized protein n=1 Tax=Neisseria subflava TaxID=28449 RepID=A0A9X9R0J6_NEISU|nr:hypothetical protein [Neisseria subflava]VTY10106.1 Uncharacterised protein [Neisseria subflava]